MTLYILKYNNYYNRLVKSYDNMEDYEPYITYTLQSTNFNPADGVDTTHVFGAGEYDGTGDYLIAYDNNEIVSRWFILDAVRTRAGQYQLTLHRDLVVDYYNVIKQSPMYIEKGYVGNDNPLVYNSENVTFNQIKKGEYLLRNELNTPWIVAYLSRFNGEGVYNTFEGSFKLEPQEADYELESLDDYQYSKYTSANPYVYTDDITFYIKHRSSADGYTSPNTIYKFGLTKSGYKNEFLENGSGSYMFSNTRYPSYKTEAERKAAYDECYTRYLTYNSIDSESNLPVNTYSKVGTFEGYKTLFNESGKVIKVGSDYYMVVSHASNSIYSYDNRVNLGSSAGTFGEYVYNRLVNSNTAKWTTPFSNPVKATWLEIPSANSGIYLSFKKLDRGTINYNFSYSYNVTRQAPYEIIVAPLNNITLTYKSVEGGQPVTKTIQHSGEVALQWFLNLGEKHTAGLVYDIQIVPYCPIYDTDLTSFDTVSCYFPDSVDDKLAVAVKIPEASFTRLYPIPKDLPIDLDYKTSVNCDLYRLCSPNGMGDFDFSVAKNKGLNGFEVDCTLIPYNPYIKVNPAFDPSGLYGGDWNDYRGLICKGDFSLPVTTDQWETYELQNKNYQAIFDRETATLEMQNKWARAEAWTNIGTGTLGGAAGGALAGSMVQPGVGTVLGAIGGGVMSAAGGFLDALKLKDLQNEMMSARHDQFELNLQTIRARPNTLSRTTAYNINNKYFPYIEYYTCTDVEKEAFRYKMKYDGMTVSAIGNIENYLNPIDTTFVKGRLIRLEGVDEDYHVAQEIVNELNKGVYI